MQSCRTGESSTALQRCLEETCPRGYNFPLLPGGSAASSGEGDVMENHRYLAVFFLTCSLLFTADPAMGGR